MAEFNEENKVEIKEKQAVQEEQVVQEKEDVTVFKKVEASNLPAKQTVWSKIKSLLAEKRNLNSLFNIQLTPYQQKIENEINEFLYQEISFEGVTNFFKKSATLFKKSAIALKKIVRLNNQEKESSVSQEQNGNGS